MTNLTLAIMQLEQERNRLSSRIEQLNKAVYALTVASGTRRGTISFPDRTRIAAAQRARWARTKGRKVVSTTWRKRTLSAAARKRIVAAQKARWAKWRKAKKTG